MKSFIELVTEIKKSFDQEDNNVLANIENSIELTSIATVAHATDSYLIYNKKLYKVIDDIAVGDTLDSTPTTGNIELADDIIQLIASKSSDLAGLTDVQLSSLADGEEITYDATSQKWKNTSKIKDINAEIADMNNVLGAKNLLRNNGVGTSTDNGITYTKQSDGSVIANGTATGWAYYNLCSRFTLDAGTYILSGKESLSGTQIKLLNADTSADIALLIDTSEEIEFTLSTRTNIHAMLYVGVDAGTVTNFVFYPMLRLASITDDTYVPYSMTNQQMTPYVQAISNPNLLDNPWFTVNQRGAVSYNSVNYTVDRWKLFTINSIVNVSNNGIELVNNSSIYASILQFLDSSLSDFLFGKTITVSALYADGSIKSLSGNLPTSAPSSTTNYAQVTKDGTAIRIEYNVDQSRFAIRITQPSTVTTSPTIRAIKLELGSVSTLAMDTAPNYATELLKCQRYFVRISSNLDEGITQYGQSLNGYGLYASSARVMLPKCMRTRPIITYSSLSDFKLVYNGKSVIPTDIQLAARLDDFINVRVEISDTDLQYYPCCLRFDNTDAYIDFSADL